MLWNKTKPNANKVKEKHKYRRWQNFQGIHFILTDDAIPVLHYGCYAITVNGAIIVDEIAYSLVYLHTNLLIDCIELHYVIKNMLQTMSVAMYRSRSVLRVWVESVRVSLFNSIWIYNIDILYSVSWCSRQCDVALLCAWKTSPELNTTGMQNILKTLRTLNWKYLHNKKNQDDKHHHGTYPAPSYNQII